MNVLVIELPEPVSANRVWRVNRRIGKPYTNPRQAAWKLSALNHMTMQKPAGGFPYFPGAFRAEIVVAQKSRKDVDNFPKGILDFLQKTARLIANDKHCQHLTVSRSDEINKGFCRVALYDVEAA